MEAFKSALPADVVDPSSLGRIRNCTIIPLAAAATVVRTFGRSPASMAWLRALSQPVPQAWELRAEQEANAAAGEVDLVLNEKLDDANFEAEETSFAAELMTMPLVTGLVGADAKERGASVVDMYHIGVGARCVASYMQGARDGLGACDAAVSRGLHAKACAIWYQSRGFQK
jgi:hypothetical protein